MISKTAWVKIIFPLESSTGKDRLACQRGNRLESPTEKWKITVYTWNHSPENWNQRSEERSGIACKKLIHHFQHRKNSQKPREKEKHFYTFYQRWMSFLGSFCDIHETDHHHAPLFLSLHNPPHFLPLEATAMQWIYDKRREIHVLNTETGYCQ